MPESFSWDIPGLNKRHFTAFANLLSLRNGGQAEPASQCDELPDQENEEDDSDTGSVDTKRPQRISYSGRDDLKRKFLDCLAEFAANKKGGQSVACTVMREAEESVELWITRNRGFQPAEQATFDELAKLLSTLSCSEGEEEQEILHLKLWKHMLAYHEERLEESYIPDLRASLIDCKNQLDLEHNQEFATEWKGLKDLRTLTFNPSTFQNLIDRHSELVIKAHELRMVKAVEKLLLTSPNSSGKTRRLWIAICSLAKLRIAFERFKEAAEEFQSFKSVAITLIPYDPTPRKCIKDALNLKEVFVLLDLPLKYLVAESVVNQRWPITKIENEFVKRQKQNFNVHAEVQMLLFLSRDGESFRGLLRYFGCSKYSCFMCSHFLQAHGKFATRGCHGRLFKPWIVPEVSILAAGQAGKVGEALIKVQKDLKKELKSEVEDILLVKTSVIGGSSVFSKNTGKASEKQKALELRKFKAEQERVAENFRRQSLEESTSAMEASLTALRRGRTGPLLDEEVSIQECDTCPREASRPCSICGKGSFCSQYCQDNASVMHIFGCSRRALTTADYLYRSILEDELPEDEDVVEHFGFRNLTSYADISKLFGLYKGLGILNDDPKITVDDLHHWQVEGSLVENIKKYYFKIPEEFRGGYFGWFLEHTDIFDREITKEEAIQATIDGFYDEARSYLDEEDREKKPSELQPSSKREAYQFLAENLHMAHPDPIEIIYRTFGFCTCSTEREEDTLGGLYQTLLLGDKLFSDVDKHIRRPIISWHRKDFQIATFTEFWKAYESGSLIRLMDSKGLRDHRLEFPFLEEFLSVPPRSPRLSVWSLKQFIAINNPAEFPPDNSVRFDYGFLNCKNFEETCTLVEIYRRLLPKANPLELHQACLNGKLFEFGERFHRMDPGYKRLMKNFYPLTNMG